MDTTLKTALISGASRGIGKTIAVTLSQNGYRVILIGRDQSSLQEAQSACGSQALLFKGDMTQEDDQIACFGWLQAQGITLDLVVANVGSGKSISGWDIPLSEYQKMMEINFFSAVGVATKSIPYLNSNRKNTQVILISSIAGCEEIGAPIPYTAAKVALLGFSKALSEQVAHLGVRVNAISPGNVFFEGSTWDDKLTQNPEKTKAYIEANVALNRFVTPEEIAKTVLFLEDNTAITGANIVVDAGQIRRMN